MAVSRPLLLALLAALLCALTFYAATGARRTSEARPAEPPTPPAAEVPALEQPESPAPGRDGGRPGDRASDVPPTGARSGARGEAGRERTRRGADSRGERDRAEGREAGRRVAPKPLPPELRVAGLPRPVARALDAKRTIVLLFRQDAADDSLTSDAVDGVRGMRGVSVFAAPIERLGRYRAVIGGLGITRVPAVAILDSKRRARVIEGVVDPATLRQLVLDAR
jgi:hypothetical protein